MDLVKLAKHFACQTPEKMKWRTNAGMAECRGCGMACGHYWPKVEETPEEYKPEQTELKL